MFTSCFENYDENQIIRFRDPLFVYPINLLVKFILLESELQPKRTQLGYKPVMHSLAPYRLLEKTPRLISHRFRFAFAFMFYSPYPYRANDLSLFIRKNEVNTQECLCFIPLHLY